MRGDFERWEPKSPVDSVKGGDGERLKGPPEVHTGERDKSRLKENGERLKEERSALSPLTLILSPNFPLSLFPPFPP